MHHVVTEISAESPPGKYKAHIRGTHRECELYLQRISAKKVPDRRFPYNAVWVGNGKMYVIEEAGGPPDVQDKRDAILSGAFA